MYAPPFPLETAPRPFGAAIVLETVKPVSVPTLVSDELTIEDGSVLPTKEPVGMFVALARLIVDGVPRFAFVKVGEVANTTLPDPVDAALARTPELLYRKLPPVPLTMVVDPTVMLAAVAVIEHPVPKVQDTPLMVIDGLARSAFVTSPVALRAPVTVRPAKVGAEAKTKTPVPVGVAARAEPTPVPRPVMLVEGRPVAFVNVNEVGVPKLGDDKVGEVDRTILPDPVVVLPRAVTVPEVGKVNDVFPDKATVKLKPPVVDNEPPNDTDFPPTETTAVDKVPDETFTSPVNEGN